MSTPGVNVLVFGGNLTRDVETRNTTSGHTVAAFGMANNRRGGGREETTFLDVECWGKTAEFAEQYLSKGRGVVAEGRLRQDSWEDRQTGQKRSKLVMVAERIHFADSRQADGDAQAEPRPRTAPSGRTYTPPPAPKPAEPVEPGEDDIPF